MKIAINTGGGDAPGLNAVICAVVRGAVAKGVVVRSSRVGTGFVRRNVEVNDDALGTVAVQRYFDRY